jgi:hypothetical protein
VTEGRRTITTRSVVLLPTLLVARPASVQDQFEEATRATAAACAEFLDQERWRTLTYRAALRSPYSASVPG